MSSKPIKPMPAWLLALGHNHLPKSISLQGHTYHLQRLFKHDFWAASGLYQGPRGKVVLKIYRRQDLLGLPLLWLGRWLAHREVCFYRLLADLPQIPTLLGKFATTGFVHQYIPGKTLLETKPQQVPDDFFDQLLELLVKLHERGISYVDSNKRDNVIVGRDGRPYLIDFQISWRPPSRGPAGLVGRILQYMQRMDIYHVLKHKSRLRPDLMSPQQWQLRRNPGSWLRTHRLLTRGFRDLRRVTLRRLRRSTGPSREGYFQNSTLPLQIRKNS